METTPVAQDPAPDAEIEPRWLDAEEQDAWRSVLYGVNVLLEEVGAALEQDPRFQLTLGEYEILVRLSEAPGHRLRMSDLADEVVHSRSRLTHTVSRLEKRGILRRVRCAADGRGREALLTAEGMGLLQAAAPHHVAAVRRSLVDRVGREDLLTLGRILQQAQPAEPS